MRTSRLGRFLDTYIWCKYSATERWINGRLWVPQAPLVVELVKQRARIRELEADRAVLFSLKSCKCEEVAARQAIALDSFLADALRMQMEATAKVKAIGARKKAARKAP